MLIALLAAAITLPLCGEVLVKSGDKVAFMGDSITWAGWVNQPNGYLHLVQEGLARNGVKIILVPCGVSGNTSRHMIKRFENDVLRQAPAWVLISCGVNDVWHGEKGVKLEDYKKNMTAMVDMAQNKGIKVMLLTATMISEKPEDEMNKQLAAYNDFLRKLAAERKLPIADLNADMQKIVADPSVKLNHRQKKLTVDGVHMAREGDQMMARGILKAFGLPGDQIAELQKIWSTYPNSTRVNFHFSVPQWQIVEPAAKKAGKSVEDYVRDAALKAASATDN